MKILSKTKKLHICELGMKLKSHYYSKRYTVEWEVTTVSKSIFGNISENVETVRDGLSFYSIKDAEYYGTHVEKPSIAYSEHDRDNETQYYEKGIIYPIGFDTLRRTILKTDISSYDYEKFLELFSIDCLNAAVYKMNGWTIQNHNLGTLMESDEVMSWVSDHCDIMRLMNKGKIVKSIDLTPVGTYESAVTGETSEYKKSRDEIIDSELARCKQYMNFLETMKK